MRYYTSRQAPAPNLQVSLGEGTGNGHIDLVVAAGDSNEVTEVVHLVLDLDVLSEELLLRHHAQRFPLRRSQYP